MANVKITDLPAASTLTGSEAMEAVQGGDSVQTTAGAVAFAAAAFGHFYSSQDQTGNISAATAVTFNNTVLNTGVTIASSSRVTFTVAGKYLVSVRLQCANANAATQDITAWLAINGTNVTASANKLSLQTTAEGGAGVLAFSQVVTVTAAQYVEVNWAPEHADVTLDSTAAAGGPPSIPVIPSASIVATRIA